MNIIVENSGYGLDNLGDVAMLQAAVSRLRLIWPNAKIFVVTEVKENLSAYIPSSEPLPIEERRAWVEPFNLIGGLQHFFPGKAKTWLVDKEAWLRSRYPEIALKIIAWRFGKHSEKYTYCSKFVDRIRYADLVIATGGGYITDSFLPHAILLLDVLRLAQRFDRPTAMVGQGIGPVFSHRLLKIFKQVCPQLVLLSTREALLSPGIARSALGGFAKTEVVVTGDDAVEIAYKHRPSSLGNKLGINIRLASYAGITEDGLFKVGKVIHKFINSFQIEYEIIPISLIKGQSDTKAVRKMLGENGRAADELNNNVSVESVIDRVGCCRIVITGSYHGAVFALSQGVQVVALTASDYYDSKFAGLLDQFSHGLQLVHLQDDNFEELLEDALADSWQRAENERELLLEAAAKQIFRGQQTYLRLKRLIQE